jgi:hypothetical protein
LDKIKIQHKQLVLRKTVDELSIYGQWSQIMGQKLPAKK